MTPTAEECHIQFDQQMLLPERPQLKRRRHGANALFFAFNASLSCYTLRAHLIDLLDDAVVPEYRNTGLAERTCKDSTSWAKVFMNVASWTEPFNIFYAICRLDRMFLLSRGAETTL